MIYSELDKLISKTTFNSYEDYETYPVSCVSCPNCSEKINIKMNDLTRHQNSHLSNLSDDDDKSITRVSVDSLPSFTNSSLDYYCHKCKIGTRLFYDFWAGGKHGEFGFELKYLVTC